jgi:hypothetical protein
MVFGGTITAGILIVNIFHYLLSLAMTSVPSGITLAGFTMYLICAERQDNPDDSSPL